MSRGAGAVMVVDDDAAIRESLVEILTDDGYRVLEAANGRSALDQLAATPPDERPALILLDLMMPVMDGFQFRAAQTSDPALAQIPVVVLSADVSVVAKAASMNVSQILRKPIHLDELLAVVAQHCG